MIEKIEKTLQSLEVAIDSLDFDPANSRVHDGRSIETLKASLARFGQVKPIVLHKNGRTVIAGNGLLQAAKELGWKKVAVVKTQLDKSESTAYSIADNRIAELSGWDDAALTRQIESLDSLDSVGWSGSEVEELLAITKFSTSEVEEVLNKKSDDGFTKFEIVLYKDDKQELMDVLNSIKKDHNIEKVSDSLMYLVRNFNE